MKTWKSFVKRNIEWMILSAVLFFLHVLYLFLIGRTGDDLIYAGILDLCIIAAAVCMAYIRYYRKVRYLKGILQQPFSGELKLPETEDLTEELLGQLAEKCKYRAAAGGQCRGQTAVGDERLLCEVGASDQDTDCGTAAFTPDGTWRTGERRVR